MQEVKGNLWTFPADYRIITTNGSIRADGNAVMGRGCAKEAVRRFPMLPKDLAVKIQRQGNHVYLFPQYALLTFPTKHYWHDKADLDLIAQSTEELMTFLNPRKRYLMVRPGCGNGGLEWAMVKPIVDTLPQNVRVITFPVLNLPGDT